jgi:hypothetical protein
VARAGRLDRRQEIGLAERLHEVAEHPGLDRAGDELLLAVGRHHHDRDGTLVEDPPGRVDAVELRHLHVEQREVGPLAACERHRLLAVARLGDDLEAASLEQLAQVEPDDRLVLGDQDAHRPVTVSRRLAARSRPRPPPNVGAARPRGARPRRSRALHRGERA